MNAITNYNRNILLINLGSPNNITDQAITHYLQAFLSDRHVVDLPAWFWQPLLNYVIIPKRLPDLRRHYQQIAINAQSPLLYYSQSLCRKLQLNHPNWHIELAMTYGQPDLAAALSKFNNAEEIDILCLYPQYSTTTTLAAINKIKTIIKQWQNLPKLQFVEQYADHPDYIKQLAQSVINALKTTNQADTLLLSYHSIPCKYISKRHDPYITQCEQTTRLLRDELVQQGITLSVEMAYQSKFGKGKWVSPNTSDRLSQLGKQQQSVMVMCPGFAADCIETLYEIDQLNREIFIQSGGKNFYYIPALNDSDEHVALISTILNTSNKLKLR